MKKVGFLIAALFTVSSVADVIEGDYRDLEAIRSRDWVCKYTKKSIFDYSAATGDDSVGSMCLTRVECESETAFRRFNLICRSLTNNTCPDMERCAIEQSEAGGLFSLKNGVFAKAKKARTRDGRVCTNGKSKFPTVIVSGKSSVCSGRAQCGGKQDVMLACAPAGKNPAGETICPAANDCVDNSFKTWAGYTNEELSALRSHSVARPVSTSHRDR